MNRNSQRSWPLLMASARRGGAALALGTALLSGCRETARGTSSSTPLGDVAEVTERTPADAGPVATASAPRAGCALAERLVVPTTQARSVLRARGSSALALDSSHSELAGCRDITAGPDVWYALDLSGFEAAVELHAVVDANFDAVLELRRGACGDTASLDCDRARGIASTPSSIAASLEPGTYWLVVDGADATSRGDFELQVEVDPTPRLCSDTPASGTCAAPLPVEPLERQTLLLDETCLPRAEDEHANAWYGLDLQSETGPVLLQAAAWTLSEPAFQELRLYEAPSVDGECGSELSVAQFSRGLGRSNAELTALLSPGRYALQLSLIGEAQRRAALELSLDRDTCRAGPLANHCEDALSIDPSLPSQVLAGNTACNANRFVSRCAQIDAPEQFYRLDLRSAPGPVRARVTTLVDGLGFSPILALLAADSDGACPDALYCDDSLANFEGPPHLDLSLDPELYYVVIDGEEPGARGTYRLLVELEPAEKSPCVDARIDRCMYANGQADCCLEWSPVCAAAVTLCGLAAPTQECLCAAAPACCAPERDASACRDARAACNYLCPESVASENACLARLP